MKSTSLHILFVIALLVLVGQISYAQNLAIEVKSSSCQRTGQNMPLSDIVSINGPDNDLLEGIQITITKNYSEAEDLFTYSFADNIQGSFDAQNGIFNLSGQSSIANYRKALDRLLFSSTTASLDQKTINITLSGVDFLVF